MKKLLILILTLGLFSGCIMRDHHHSGYNSGHYDSHSYRSDNHYNSYDNHSYRSQRSHSPARMTVHR